MPVMGPQPRLRPATTADAGAMSAIYNHYVRTSTCTFQEQEESLAERERWLAAHTGGHVALVAEEEDGTIAGWGSLSPFHARSAFRFTVEDSVYLRPDRCGRGLGGVILGELVRSARAGGFRQVVASICAEQEASVALHRRHGFVPAAHFRAVGLKFARWLDVVYLQLDLQAEP